VSEKKNVEQVNLYVLTATLTLGGPRKLRDCKSREKVLSDGAWAMGEVLAGGK